MAAITERRAMITCTECKSEGSAAPMLRDEAWARIAGPCENLCAACVWKRLKERGVRIELASLKPCPFNLFHRPMSWFDIFTRWSKDDPPVDIAAWLRAERDLRKIDEDAPFA
jgi:hypothetical protein